MTAANPSPTDASLVHRALGGDEQAYRALLDAHRGAIFRLVRHMVGDEEEARDITQQAFIAAFSALGRFDTSLPLRTWLKRIAINKCRDWARKRAVRRLVWGAASLDAAAGVSAEEAQPDRATFSWIELARVSAAMERLPHRLREILVLRGIEQHSQQETAEILGITPKAVETRLYRARTKLTAACRAIGRGIDCARAYGTFMA